MLKLDEVYNRKIYIHIQRSPGCTITGIVPVFTYASQPPVTRGLAGVLAAVGFMRYLALMPPPIISTPTEICRIHLLGIPN